MLESVDALTDDLKKLPEELIPLTAATNFINLVANFMNKVQASSIGNPGIFTYNNAVAIPLIAALPPVINNSWILPFATAIEAGVLAGTITPGTVANPAWTASGVDVATLPSPASTITTLEDAKAILIQDLALVISTNNPPQPLAQAIYDYTKAFTFLCIGIAAGSPPSPVPIPLNAE